jgi:all-trans-retinol dehydrogenase (NAD+)
MVKKFLSLGCHVVVWDVVLPATENKLDKVDYHAVDVTNREQVYALAERIGQVDVLVLNAGIVSGKTFLNNDDAAMEKVVQVNCISHFWATKAFLPGMLSRNRGHIVSVSSAAGTIGVVGLADYCASKWGASGFLESLRFELRSLNSSVQTTLVQPFFIATPLFRGARTRFPLILPILQPEYVAEQIVQAVLTGKEVLNMPWMVNLTPCLRFLPTPIFDWIAEFIGSSSSMDKFVGNGKKVV